MQRHQLWFLRSCFLIWVMFCSLPIAVAEQLAMPAGHAIEPFRTTTKGYLQAGDSENVTLVSRLPDGCCHAAAVQGSMLYHGDGGYLVMTEMEGPVEVGRYILPSYIRDIAVDGNHAYVASARAGLRIVDVSDVSAAVEVGSVPTGQYSYEVALEGSYAYVASAADGLRVIDVSTPSAPAEVAVVTPNLYIIDVVVEGTRAYVLDYIGSYLGVRIFDVSVPTVPVEVGTYSTGYHFLDLDVQGNYLYLAGGIEGLRIIDVTNPALPVEVGSWQYTYSDTYLVVVDGTRAYTMFYHDTYNTYEPPPCQQNIPAHLRL